MQTPVSREAGADSSEYSAFMMALHFKDHEAERLDRVAGRRSGPALTDVIAAIAARCAAVPALDDRRPDDILGYDEHGLPA